MRDIVTINQRTHIHRPLLREKRKIKRRLNDPENHVPDRLEVLQTLSKEQRINKTPKPKIRRRKRGRKKNIQRRREPRRMGSGTTRTHRPRIQTHRPLVNPRRPPIKHRPMYTTNHPTSNRTHLDPRRPRPCIPFLNPTPLSTTHQYNTQPT